MFAHIKQQRQLGFTYIELIIVSAIMVLVFGAILISFQFALQQSYTTRAKLSALSLANDRMEFFRSLPYNDVGVIAGFPTGTIPQNTSFTLNNFSINERVRVDYIDDAADGLLGADTNTITQDYKQIKVEYTWTLNGKPGELSLVSNIVPRSIETNVGGGTIRINVLDADSSFLSGASVRVLSSSSTFAYDVTNPTDLTGAALFSVPADSGYQVFVTANIAGRQYSTSSTYIATTTNPVPVVAPFTVVEAGISTLTFQIGELSDLSIKTLSAIIEGEMLESFTDLTGIATSTNATTTSGELVLRDVAGIYETVGSAYTNTIAPVSLLSWETVRIAADLPINTNYVTQFYTGTSGAYVLVPDAELAGNSIGFTDTLIDLSELDVSLYPTTTIGITLSTTDTSITPVIDEIVVYWREAETDISGENLSVRGGKTIGAELDATPIYKFTENVITDGTGEVVISDLEFDTYTVTPTGLYSVAMACPTHPVNHVAGTDDSVELLYVPEASINLRILVVDTLGRAIPGVSVRLDRGGYDETQSTNTCGQTFFSGGGLTDDVDYDLTVSAPGYTTETVDPFEINGETIVTVILAS